MMHLLRHCPHIGRNSPCYCFQISKTLKHWCWGELRRGRAHILIVAPNSNYSPLELLASITHPPSYVSVAATTKYSTGNQTDNKAASERRISDASCCIQTVSILSFVIDQFINLGILSPHLQPMNTFRRADTTFLSSSSHYPHSF